MNGDGKMRSLQLKFLDVIVCGEASSFAYFPLWKIVVLRVLGTDGFERGQ